MRLSALPLFLVLAACGREPDCVVWALPFEADAPPVDCVIVASNADLARSILISRHLATEGELGAAFAGVRVRIRDTVSWETSEGVAYGEWSPGEIDVNRHTQELVHEMLHQIEDYRNGSPNPGHEGWGDRGFNAASIEYHSRLTWL